MHPLPDVKEQRRKEQKDQWRWQVEQALKTIVTSDESTIAYGRDALKSVVLINGGAAVTLLAFISQVAKGAPTIIPTLTPALLCFGAGVLVGGLATASSYLSQMLHGSKAQSGLFEEKRVQRGSSRWGIAFQMVAMVLVLGGFGLFAWGAWTAADAMQVFTWPPSQSDAPSASAPT